MLLYDIMDNVTMKVKNAKKRWRIKCQETEETQEE